MHIRYHLVPQCDSGRQRRSLAHPDPRSTASIVASPLNRADVLVVVERVVGVVLGLDLGESPVDVIAVGLSNATGYRFAGFVITLCGSIFRVFDQYVWHYSELTWHMLCISRLGDRLEVTNYRWRWAASWASCIREVRPSLV
jgi:hypothetical protein